MGVVLHSLLVFCLVSSIAQGQVSWRQWRNQCLEVPPLKTINGVSLVDCQNLCLGESEFICMAIEYVADLSTCYLTNTSSHWTKTQNPCQIFGTDLLEISLATTWAVYTDSCLQAYADKSYSGVVEVLCREYCETELDFDCQSFNFDYLNNICGLSSENDDTRMLSTPCDIQGIDTHIKAPEPIYKFFPMHTLSGGSSLSTDSDITQFQCMESCSILEDCKSIIYEPGRSPPRCTYLRNSGVTNAIVASSSLNYAERVERPKWRNFGNTCMVESVRNYSMPFMTQNGCTKACAAMYGYGSDFDCKSVSYDRDTGTCYLHEISTTTEGAGLSSPCVNDEFTYHEIIDCDPSN